MGSGAGRQVAIQLEQGGGEDAGWNPDEIRWRRERTRSGVRPGSRRPPGPIVTFFENFFSLKKKKVFVSFLNSHKRFQEFLRQLLNSHY